MLFHRDLGGSGLPPLVILHGLLGSSRNWQTAGRDLATHYHVFALDLRNHGASPHADEMSYDAMASDVIAWLDHQGLQQVILMGHSMGGKVAMLLACRFPSRVARLVVVDSAPKDYYWVAHRAEFDAMNALDLHLLPSRANAEKQFETRVADWTMRKFLATNLERVPDGGWRWVVNLPALTAALSTLEKNPLQATDQFVGPVVFITGGKSPYVESSDWPLLMAHFPAVRWESIAESGHNPHMEVREKFVTLLRSLLD